MKRRLTLQFCPDEFSNTGVPLVLLEYSDEVQSGPYLKYSVLVSYAEAGVDASTVEFINALMSDLERAAKESREAALMILKRLDAIQFGAIRGLSEFPPEGSRDPASCSKELRDGL